MILSDKFKTNYQFKLGKELLHSDEAMIELILTWCDKLKVSDTRQVAYILSSIFHEGAGHFKPIEEIGKGKGKPYGTPNASGKTYFGRGLIQCTWDYNYAKFKRLLGVDLIDKPELALVPDISVQIAVRGMKSGLFTGKKLDDYFNLEKEEPVNARRIVNGQDKAVLIANYYVKFLDLLTT